MPQPKTSDEAPDEWGDDDYVDLTQVIERLELTDATSEQPTEMDDE